MTTYLLDREPRHVLDRDGPLPGHYEAEFSSTEDGRRVRRYLTDKGRAEVLRRFGEGRHEYSETELRDLTVEPELEALVARMEHEAGEGG